VKRGKTPVLTAEWTRRLLDSIDVSTPVGLRDRALIAVMTFALARVGSAAPDIISRLISPAERDRLLALGPDLAAVWNAQTTTPRDRKQLLRTLIEDVMIRVDRDKATAHFTLRWKDGALNEIDLALPRSRPIIPIL
jgi:hypothetical protein